MYGMSPFIADFLLCFLHRALVPPPCGRAVSRWVREGEIQGEKLPMTAKPRSEYEKRVLAYLRDPTNPSMQDRLLEYPWMWLEEIYKDTEDGPHGGSLGILHKARLLSDVLRDARDEIESCVRSGNVGMETSQGFFVQPRELLEQTNLHYFTLALFYLYLHQSIRKHPTKTSIMQHFIPLLEMPVTRASGSGYKRSMSARLSALSNDHGWYQKQAREHFEILNDLIAIIRNRATSSTYDPNARVLLSSLVSALGYGTPTTALRGPSLGVSGSPHAREDMIIAIADYLFEPLLNIVCRVRMRRISQVPILLPLGGLNIACAPIVFWTASPGLVAPSYVDVLRSMPGRSVRDMLERELFRALSRRDIVQLQELIPGALHAALATKHISDRERKEAVKWIMDQEKIVSWQASRAMPLGLVLLVSVGAALRHARGTLKPSGITSGWPVCGPDLVAQVREVIQYCCEGTLTLGREDLLAIALHSAVSELAPHQWRNLSTV